MNNNTGFIKKLLIAVAITCGLGGVGYLAYRHQYTQQYQSIIEFDEARDTQEILDLFEQNWYWLVADDDYSPEFMLKYRAPKQDVIWAGRMHIKVLREHDQFIGFIAYYMKANNVWFLNFLAIKPEFRGKRYADRLMRYALDDMRAMGAARVDLITRPSNTSAQKVYNRNGFELTDQEGDYVFFSHYFTK